ncbi:MAG: hypothetical protein QOJ50_3945, partial [Cryptosporangiaceae bacterium]|nr:hypothetical protein [Cryptosporangiaceae bacterium]
MEEAPPGWPLLLAGPMVRRVGEDSASVFVACRDPVRVGLSIWDGTGPGRAAVDRTSAHTLPLGQFLHVALVTVQPSRRMDPGRCYGYDLDFSGHGNLGSLGLLGALAYEPDHLPSFAVPPARLADVRITHGSCRKPQGGR